MRPSRAAFVGVLGVAIVGLGLRYASLPPVVASHFDPSGQPNAWMDRSVFAWFSVVPLVVVFVVTYIGPLLVAKLPPALVNLPNKDYWLAPDRREETIRRFSAKMEWFGVALLVFLAFVYELVLEANIARRELSNGAFIAALVAFLVFAIGWSVSLHRAFSLPRNETP